MAILKDTNIKGDLNVSEKIIENGNDINKKYATSIVLENGILKVLNSYGETLSEILIGSVNGETYMWNAELPETLMSEGKGQFNVSAYNSTYGSIKGIKMGGNETNNTTTYGLHYSHDRSTYDNVYNVDTASWVDEGYREITFTDKGDNTELDMYLDVCATPVTDSSEPDNPFLDDEVDKQITHFFIDGTLYNFEEGMTWFDWVDSEYNTDGYFLSTDGRLLYVVESGGWSATDIAMSVDYIIMASDSFWLRRFIEEPGWERYPSEGSNS